MTIVIPRPRLLGYCPPPPDLRHPLHRPVKKQLQTHSERDSNRTALDGKGVRAAAALTPLRLTLRSAVDSSTLRNVAGEVGISPQGLLNFLNGTGMPRPGTTQKLREWDLRRRALGAEFAASGPPDAATLDAAFRVLTWNLSGDERGTAERAVLETLRGHGVEIAR